MTTLSIRKTDKAELQAHIDGEIAAYAIRFDGFDIDYSAEPDARGNYPRKHFLGAVTEIVEATAVRTLQVLEAKLGEGYKLFIDGSLLPEIGPHYSKFYIVKPVAPAVVDGKEQRIEGVEYQVDDIEAIKKEVTAKNEQEIENHNDKVYAQELAALKEEEAAIASQLKADDAAKAAADLERRVRDRMRGNRAAQAKTTKATEAQQ